MNKRTRLVAAGLAAILALTAAACGDDDDGGSAGDSVPAGDDGGSETPSSDGGESGSDCLAGSGDSGTESSSAGSAAGSMPGASGTTAAASPGGGGAGLKVGLLFDITGRGDKSFNDAAAAGLDKAAQELGIDPSESEPAGEGDRAERLDALAQAGNDLIIAVGFLWGDALDAGAKSHPDTSFAIIDSVVEAPNVASLTFAEHEGSFLVGAAAALKSQTGKIGYIGGVENELIRKFEAGYVAGAQCVDPDIEIERQYISDDPAIGFNDPTKAKEIARAMYEADIDVIYHAAGASGDGMFEAAANAGEPGEVWAIGVDSDQYQQVPAAQKPYILTSMLKRVDVAVFDIVQAAVDGSFESGVKVYDLSVDGVGYATSGGFVDDIAPQLDELKQLIIDGEIEVPTTPDD